MNGLQALDQEIFRAIHLGWSSPWLDLFFLFFSYLGLGQIQAGLSLLLLRWRATRYYVLPLLSTIILSGLVVAQGIKNYVVPRERPSNLIFSLPQEGHFYDSFPSGHTTTSFATAFMLVFVTYGTRRWWVGYLAMAIAILVGISRIYRGVHWPSDVLGGAMFGAFSAAVVYLVLDRLGHWLHLDQPEATLTGREASEADTAAT